MYWDFDVCTLDTSKVRKEEFTAKQFRDLGCENFEAHFLRLCFAQI